MEATINDISFVAGVAVRARRAFDGDALRRWENEGGQVPTLASQLEPREQALEHPQDEFGDDLSVPCEPVALEELGGGD
jgi:hypothetical protein